MDDFAKRYLIGLTIVLVMAVGWYFLNQDGRVGEINAVLARDMQLADYPYQFQVQSLDAGVATMGSPRSSEVPVMRFLRAAFPELSATPVNHPDMMAAQQILADKQARAAERVTAQPDVER